MRNNRRRIRSTASGVFGLALLATSGACSEARFLVVHSEYGPGIQFDGIGHRFQWTSNITPVTGDSRADNPQLHDRIRATVESQLAGKGFESVSDGQPDFWLAYRVARKQRRDARLGDVEEGSLLLEVVDPKTRQRIWAAAVRARLNRSDPPDRRRARINDAIEAIMKHFPHAEG